MASEIQTLVFSKENWTLERARSWLNDHDFRSDKVDETDQSYRFRQFDPAQCTAGSFVTLTENFPAGCHAVSCNRSEGNALSRDQAKEQNPMNGREFRIFAVKELRVESGKDNTLRISGHAAVFNQLSEELGGLFMKFREKILPGAFAKSIHRDDVRSLFNHDANFILGRTKSRTLRLREDDRGLAIENDLPDTQYARDLAKSMERGDIDQMSFGFETVTDYWQQLDGEDVRSLVEVKLYDVSPVTFPAYPQTDVAMRSLEQAKAQGYGAVKPKSNLQHYQEFLARRTPPPDPYSLEEIIKRARIKRDKKEGD